MVVRDKQKDNEFVKKIKNNQISHEEYNEFLSSFGQTFNFFSGKFKNLGDEIYDEYLNNKNYLFWEAIKDYDESKSAFSTFLTLKIRNYYGNTCRKEIGKSFLDRSKTASSDEFDEETFCVSGKFEDNIEQKDLVREFKNFVKEEFPQHEEMVSKRMLGEKLDDCGNLTREGVRLAIKKIKEQFQIKMSKEIETFT